MTAREKRNQARRLHRKFRRLRFDLLLEQGGRCAYCEVPVRMPRGETDDHPHMATLDHVVPRAARGRTVRENLVVACQRCNRRKADMPVESFRALLAAEAAP